MNGHKEHRSRQSSRGGRRTVQSVPPSSRDESGRSARSSGLSSSLKVSVQPPVCGVQPGKVLELRTTLGLMRARALLDRQMELERREATEADGGLRGEGAADVDKQIGRLKHGRLQPLGVVSDRTRISGSCLGIVSVSSQRQQDQRPRSCTEPGINFGTRNSATRREVRESRSSRREKERSKSYSAVSPSNTQIERLKDLAAHLSITKRTALMPKEPKATSKKNIEKDSNKSGDQKSTKMSQSHESPHTEVTQGITDSVSTEHSMQSTTADSPGKVQVLPPVVRHGELGMKVEVKGLKVIKDSASSNLKSTTSSQEQTAVTSNGRTKNDEAHHNTETSEKNQREKSPNILSQPSTRTTIEERRGLNSTITPSGESKSYPSSPNKISVVSLGEAQLVRPRIRLRRRRRHSEGRQHSGGHLSCGWSPPQAIEPLVGSPIHTPRRPFSSAALQRGSSRLGKFKGDDEHSSVLNSIRSSLTSPGLMISVDVNEFLRDTDTDDPV